jgi:hypothetical protein
MGHVMSAYVSSAESLAFLKIIVTLKLRVERENEEVKESFFCGIKL